MEGVALRVLLWALGAGALMAAGGVAWQNTPWIGPAAVEQRLEGERDQAKANAARWETSSHGWEASFHLAEGLRVGETARANAAVNADQTACDARVAEARRSSTAIRTIVRTEPARDQNNCPVRSPIPNQRLRDALQPTAGAH